MDKAIFQFDSFYYNGNDVKAFDRDACEERAKYDSCNVTKFNLNDYSIETLLNHGGLDVDNCFFRVFL